MFPDVILLLAVRALHLRTEAGADGEQRGRPVQNSTSIQISAFLIKTKTTDTRRIRANEKRSVKVFEDLVANLPPRRTTPNNIFFTIPPS